MRVLLAGLVFALAAMGSAAAGQSEAEAPPPAPVEEGAAEEPVDLQGCSACTLRHQNLSKRLKQRQAAEEARGDCQIKGDIGEDGAHLFHRPGETRYGWVWISEAKGERWFCSVEEAEAAGWRAAE
jgi:hypothetical protein